MNFFGRTQKLKELTAFYDREEENLAVIYGRRRVGKSELVCQSLKGRTEAVIYFCLPPNGRGGQCRGAFGIGGRVLEISVGASLRLQSRVKPTRL